MISFEQFKRGADIFFTREVFPKIPEKKRFIAAFGLSLMLDSVADIPFVQALGLVDEGRMIDIDRAYCAARDALNVAPFVVELPIIGSMTFTAPDIEKIYQVMKSA